MKRLTLLATMLFVSLLLTGQAGAQQWVASWTASVHGPYPVGNPTAQPELKYAFASAQQGARNQSFRLIVRPDVWGPQTRIRLSNAFGTNPSPSTTPSSACRRAVVPSSREPTNRSASPARRASPWRPARAW